MANQVFNIAKGRVAEKAIVNPNLFQLVLIKTAETDATLIDYDTVAALLLNNTEADFTNYSRKTAITGTVITDDTLNEVRVTLPDQTFTSAGGASNNTLVKALVCYSVGAGDANLIPLTHHDYVETTSGGDITLQFDAAGFWKAS